MINTLAGWWVMRAQAWIAAGTAAVLLGAPAAPPALGADEATTSVPLKRIVLFTSSVGFFEHDGKVQDNATVEMKFNVRNMNDLLMSMVVQDLGGGKVSTVNYASKTPITRTLQTFSIDLAGNPTLAELLDQVRGERVEVEAPTKIVGTIVGTEKHKRKIDDHEIIEVEVLNLLTDEGLRAVPLETVGRIKLLNERLDAELRKALAVLATAHAEEKKPVTIRFLGQGQRPVRIGYIREMPVWRTAYRLVLDDKKPPFLQGWAIVENTTEEDWDNVDLTLVSGQPISFTMDLYEALFAPRPEAHLPLYSSLQPQIYGENLARRQQEEAKRLEMAPAALRAVERAGARPAEALAARKAYGFAGAAAPRAPAWNLKQGVQTAARAGAVGELFQYAIATPVSVSRQQSAMLSIVNTDVKGEKLAIYDQSVEAKHPLNGLRLINSTDLHLMQGPITVFDGGAYAGDALIDNIPPGGERLISYAIDLDVEVAPESKSHPEQIVSVKLIKGTMQVTRKYTRQTDYTVKNSGSNPQEILIVYPIDPDWTLVEPKQPTEKTRDKYRFAVQTKPGEPVHFTIEEQRTASQQIGLTNLNESAIQVYISAATVSDKVKAALSEIVKRKQAIQQTAQQLKQVQQQLDGIVKEQSRIRQNMQQLDRTSDLYKRYVKILSDQETQIAQMNTQIQDLTKKQNDLQNELDQYMQNLDLP